MMKLSCLLAFALFLPLWTQPLAAQPLLKRTTVSVQVVPATPADVEAANQVQKIAVETFENYRNFLTRRFLEDKDVAALEELDRIVTEGSRKVGTGMRSTVFDEGGAQLNQAYLDSKARLGEMSADLVGRLYLGLAMHQAVMQAPALAMEYMMVYLNLDPKANRRTIATTKDFTNAFEQAWQKTRQGTPMKVTITANPPQALIGIDGVTWGHPPMEVNLAPGGHLVQVELDGHYRAGWIKDPLVHGDQWQLTLKPIESLGRYVKTRDTLRDLYSAIPQSQEKPIQKRGRKKAPPPPPPPDPEVLARGLLDIVKAECLFFVAVHSPGDSIQLKGVFLSPYGMFPVDRTVKRDLNVLDSIKAAMLEVSDLEAQRKNLAARQKDSRQQQLEQRGATLLESMVAQQQELTLRSAKWAVLGEKDKSSLFAVTAAEAGLLVKQVQQAMAAPQQSAADLHKQLDRFQKEWDNLGGKVRSLLAWDVDGAWKRREISQMAHLEDAAAASLSQLSDAVTQKSKGMDRQQKRDLDRLLKELRKGMTAAQKRMAQDPLDPEARRPLYRIIIESAHWVRTLTREP